MPLHESIRALRNYYNEILRVRSLGELSKHLHPVDPTPPRKYADIFFAPSLRSYAVQPERSVFVHTTHPTNALSILESGKLLPPDSLAKKGETAHFGSSVTKASKPEWEQGIFFYLGGPGYEAAGQYYQEGFPVAFLLPYERAIRHAHVKGFFEDELTQILMRGKSVDGGIPIHAMDMVHPDDVFYVRVGDKWLPAVPSGDGKHDFVVFDNTVDSPKEGVIRVNGKEYKYVIGQPRHVDHFRRHSNPFVAFHVNSEYRKEMLNHLEGLAVHTKDYLTKLHNEIEKSPELRNALDSYVRALAQRIADRSRVERIRNLARRIANGEDVKVSELLRATYLSGDKNLEALARIVERIDSVPKAGRQIALAHVLQRVAGSYADMPFYEVDKLMRAHRVGDLLEGDPSHRFLDFILAPADRYYEGKIRRENISHYYDRYRRVFKDLLRSGVARDAKTHLVELLRRKGVRPEDIVDRGDRIEIRNAEHYGVPQRILFFGKNYTEGLHEFLHRLAKSEGFAGPDIMGYRHAAGGTLPFLPVFVGELGRKAGKLRAYYGTEQEVYDVSQKDVALRRAEFFKRLEQSLEHEDPNIQPFIRAFLSAYRGELTSPPDRSLSSRAVHAAVTHLAKTFAEMEKKHGREYALFKMEEILRNKRNAYLRAWFNGNIRPTTMMLARVADRLHREVLKEMQRNLAKQGAGTGPLDTRALSKGFEEGHYGE